MSHAALCFPKDYIESRRIHEFKINSLSKRGGVFGMAIGTFLMPYVLYSPPWSPKFFFARPPMMGWFPFEDKSPTLLQLAIAKKLRVRTLDKYVKERSLKCLFLPHCTTLSPICPVWTVFVANTYGPEICRQYVCRHYVCRQCVPVPAMSYARVRTVSPSLLVHFVDIEIGHSGLYCKAYKKGIFWYSWFFCQKKLDTCILDILDTFLKGTLGQSGQIAPGTAAMVMLELQHFIASTWECNVGSAEIRKKNEKAE